METTLDIQWAKENLKSVPGWQMTGEGKIIARDFVLKDFKAGVDLINRIARIAEDLNHHPDIHLTGYKRVRVELTTHDVNGLSKNDFLEAARINEIVEKSQA